MKVLLLVFVVCCMILIHKLIEKLKRVYRRWTIIKDVPGPPIDNIILGNTREMMTTPREMLRLFTANFKDYGRLMKLWIFGTPFVFVADAPNAEIFFSSKHISLKADVYKFLHDWLGLGLLTSGGELWHQRRKLISPTFHFSILNSYAEIFVANSQNVVQKLLEYPEGASIDVNNVINLVALDNICETAMGVKVNAVNNPKVDYIMAIGNATRIIMDRIKRPWYWNDFAFSMTPAGRELKKSLDIIFKITDQVIKERKQEGIVRRARKDQDNDDGVEVKKKLAFLDRLLDASSNSESISLTDKDLRDEVNTFLFEGHDTTAAAMSFSLYLLALHPEIQRKCHEELDYVFGDDKTRKPTSEDLLNLKYLEQIIKETLRLYPSVPLISRQVTQDMQMGKHTIPEGSIVTLCIYYLHRDPLYFPDPEKFDPDRFSLENMANRHPYAYVPFSAGSRNCIGQKFAILEEKIVLSYILRNFIVEPAGEPKKVVPDFSLILRSLRALHLKFKPRNYQESCQIPSNGHKTQSQS